MSNHIQERRQRSKSRQWAETSQGGADVEARFTLEVFIFDINRFDSDKERIEVLVRPGRGVLVFLLYRMRRVQCSQICYFWQAVPASSWQEPADSFHTSWDKACDAVEYVVQWGLEHRTLGPIGPSALMKFSTPRATST